MLVSIIKFTLNLKISLLVVLQLSPELDNGILHLLVLLIEMVLIELVMLRLIPELEKLILNAIVLHFKLLSCSFSLLKVSLQELVVDYKLVHSLLEGHAVVFKLISSLSFVGQVLACSLKSINFTILLNNESIIIILV